MIEMTYIIQGIQFHFVIMSAFQLNSLPASDIFCRLLITFANSLDPDQARQNVGPDLDPNFLTLMIFLKIIFLKKKKVNFAKQNKL